MALASKDDKDEVKRHNDDTMYQSLGKIFRKRFRSNRGKIKEFLRGSRQNDADQNTTIKLQILEKLTDPDLYKHFSQDELAEKFSLLWIAVLADYQTSIELLVRFGADVNERFGANVDGDSGADVGERFGANVDEDFGIDFDVDFGAEVDERFGADFDEPIYDPQEIDEESTILHVLLQRDSSPENEQLVRLITDKGADLQARDSHGRTALHLAVKESRVQTIEVLLAGGADINAADNLGSTALLIAARRRRANELIPLLLKHGADVTARDEFGHNALHLLTISDKIKHYAGSLALALIEKGTSIHDRHDEYQYQPIHLAAFCKKNELLNLYLDHGADLNSEAYGDMLPLHLAAHRNFCNSAVLQTLLRRGAEVNRQTSYGRRTALHEAVLGYEYAQGAQNNINVLLAAGADILLEDRDGSTPLDLCPLQHLWSNPPTISMILKKLALKRVCEPTIQLKDEAIIERHRLQHLMDYYHVECIGELERMKSAEFFGKRTIFELLSKCHCRIAVFMRNPEFETKFKQYDRSGFTTYAEEIIQAFRRVQHHHRSVTEQEEIIEEGFCGRLPCEIVRKMAHDIWDCHENIK